MARQKNPFADSKLQTANYLINFSKLKAQPALEYVVRQSQSHPTYFVVGVLVEGKFEQIAVKKSDFLKMYTVANMHTIAIRRMVLQHAAHQTKKPEAPTTDFSRHIEAIKQGQSAVARVQLAFRMAEIRQAAKDASRNPQQFRQLIAAILGVDPNDEAALKREIRQVMLQLHPDKNPAGADQFAFFSSLCDKAGLK